VPCRSFSWFFQENDLRKALVPFIGVIYRTKSRAEADMKKNSLLWIQIGSAILFFIFIKLFLSYIILSSFSKLIIDAELDHDDVIEVYYSVNSQFTGNQTRRSKLLPGGKRGVYEVQLNNHVIRKLRIDPGSSAGEVKIYGLKLLSFFGETIHFNPQQLYEQFAPNSDITLYALKSDHLLISSRTNDPFLIYQGSLRHNSLFFSLTAPLIFSYLFFLFISRFQVRQFPAFYDLHHKISSTGVNIGALDGIRGLAALMVLGAHTGIPNHGYIGSLGVWLFFSLSGFLLATPFVKDPSRAVSYSFMSEYLLRRLKRILPMYYTYITFTMFYPGRNPEVFRHYLFLQGDGHLWTIPQEMLFYLVLPFIMMILYVFCRGRQLFSVMFLLASIYLANKYLNIHVIYLYGQGTKMPSMAGIFLSGVFFSYIYHYLYQSQFFQRVNGLCLQRFCSVFGLALLVALMILSSRLLLKLSFFDAITYSGINGFCAGILILLVVLSGNTLLGKIMSFLPLRAVGLVGFSFYLLHPMILSVNKQLAEYYFHLHPSNIVNFFVTGIAAYILSALTYTYIERPFLKKQSSS
jgi:peptidoglycan/LPS O-acetylase OafA/YrhL